MNDEPFLKVMQGSEVLYVVEESKDAINEYAKMAEGMSKLNVSRGGGNIKGFYAEFANTAESNIERANKGLKSKEIVLGDNGVADAQIKYKNGQWGRTIQDKCGYTKYKHRDFIESGKYDNMIYRVNVDNPVLDDPEFLKLAKEHKVKVVTGESEKNMEVLAEAAKKEGQLRQTFHLSNNAPLVSQLNALSREMKYIGDMAVNAAGCAGAFSAGMSLGKNMYAYWEGDMDLSEMAKEVAKEVAKESVKSAVVTGTSSMAIGTVTAIAANMSVVGAVAELQVVQSVSGFLMNFNGITAVLSSAGLGSMFVAGLVVGVSAATISTIHKYCEIKKINMKKHMRFMSLCTQCSEIISKQRVTLKQEIEETYGEWKESFDKAYEQMIDAILDEDVESLSIALKMILEPFGKDVAFSDYDSFDAAFLNSDYVLQM
jgi:hypothetical protein